MFILKESKLRANPFAQYTDAEGTVYPRIPSELLEEIADPLAPDDYSEDNYFRTEQDAAPYVVFTKKSDEMIAEQKAGKAAQKAQSFLDGTDYLFSLDRHSELLANEPERESQLRSERANARETVRLWKSKQVKA
jgi:hypothetical protein